VYSLDVSLTPSNRHAELGFVGPVARPASANSLICRRLKAAAGANRRTNASESPGPEHYPVG